MDLDAAISEHVSRLLQVYGPEAVECLESLSLLLKDRLDTQESAPTADDGIDNTGNGTGVNNTTTTTFPNDLLPTVGTIDSIVLQTLNIEQNASSSDMESLVQAGIDVLRYWSCLQQHIDDQAIIDPICELMTKYPQNEIIQESACVRLSKQTSLLITPTRLATSPASAGILHAEKKSQIQRIMFPVLQAMNWHKNNPVLWNAGMIVMTRLLVKSSSSSATDLTERQSQAIALIDLTGGLSIFFDSLLKQNSTNKSIQSELKVNVCNALAALALNHPDNQALIAKQPGLSRVLDTMKLYAHHIPLQQSLLQLLASLAYGAESKAILLSKGGLDCILTSMKEHPMESTIQGTGCRAIANLFAGTTSDIRAKGALCVKPTLRAMRMHPPQVVDGSKDDTTTAAHEEPELSSVQIHFYGCAALLNLSKAHSRAIVETGGISTLLVTLAEYSNRPSIQENGWGALYYLMQTGTKDDCLSVCTEGGLETLLETLRQYSNHSRIQLMGMRCLTCLAATEKLQIMERMVSGKVIDLLLSALHRYHKTGPGELLFHSCTVLVHLTKNNPDFQLFVIVKNGINILIMVLQHTKKDVQVQLVACQILKNLCRDNLSEAASSGSMLPMLLSIVVNANPDQTELMVCVLETLGYLTTLQRFQKEIVARQALEEMVPFIKDHKDNLTLFELGIKFLSNCTQEPDATLWMKRHDVIPFLQTIIPQLPRRSSCRILAQELMEHLRTTRVFLSKFSARRKI